MADEVDPFPEYLADGWEVCGYSVSLMAMGATSQHILMRKGTSLAQGIILNNGAKELGRSVVMISPKPAPKRGFFG